MLVIISLLFLTLAIGYGIFQTSYFQKILINKITAGISKSIDADVSIGRVKFSLFTKVVLDDFYLSDQNKDTLLYTSKLVASIDSLSLKNNALHFKSITLDNPKVMVEKTGDSIYNFSFLFGEKQPSQNKPWSASISMLEIEDGIFCYSDTSMSESLSDFVHLSKINLSLDKLKFPSSKRFAFNLNQLSFQCRNGFAINEFSSKVSYTDSIFDLQSISVASDNSLLKVDSLHLDLKEYLLAKNIFDLRFDSYIERIKLDYKDIAFLLSDYDGNSVAAEISGRIYGKLSEIKGKNVKARLEDLTRLNGDFYINGLPDIENTYLFVNLFESYANLIELRNLKLPKKIFPVEPNMPKFLDNLGVFTYKGNFTGFLNDFVAYGTAYSNLGTVDGDVSFQPDKNQSLKVKGRINTRNLRIGSLFNTEYLGKLTLSGKIDGSIRKSNYDFTFNGIVDTIDVFNYKYKNIEIKGNIKNNHFDGALSIDDPNLKMNYLGSLDISPNMPTFRFKSQIDYADLQKLNLLKTDSIAKISGVIDANFEGKDLDMIKGVVDVKQLRFKNSKAIMFLENAQLKNDKVDSTNILSLRSDWADIDISGHYSFKTLNNSLINLYEIYFPSSLPLTRERTYTQNRFLFTAGIKNTDALTKAFLPSLVLEKPFTIKGFFDETNKRAHVETILPVIKYAKQEADNLSINVEATPEQIRFDLLAETYKMTEKVETKNLTINSTGKNDMVNLDVHWENQDGTKNLGKLKTVTTFERTETKYPHIEVKMLPSWFIISDSLWSIDQSVISIDSTSFDISQLLLKNGEQRIKLWGNINENPASKAKINLQNIDIRLIDLLIGQSGLGGKINGNLDITDLYKKKKINLDLIINSLSLNQATFGDLSVKSDWSPELEKLIAKLTLKDEDRTLIDGAGAIDPMKSLVDFNLNLDKAPLKFLELLTPFLFYDISGEVNGRMRVSGKIDHLMFNGKLTPETRIGMGITPTKSHYYFSDPVVFKADSILFPAMRIEDEMGNNGIFSGHIAHQSFGKMRYNLTVDTDKLMAMNISSSDNEYFYGTAFVSGFLKINGYDSDVSLVGNLKTARGTNINIPLDTKSTIEHYDFIRFTNVKEEIEQTEYKLVSNGLNMNFDIDINPEAKVQLIFNSQMGDIIKGEGNGNLQVKVDKDFNIKLYGDYVIEKGDYLFTLENIINKRFTINQGGTIKWTGEPYDADINLTAVYKVKTSLYDLFPESSTDMDLVRRMPVDCVISLSESLMQPKINFKIELPTAEQSIQDQVKQIIVTEEDVNKQMLSLLMLGRFYTPEIYAGKTTTVAGSEIVTNTASTTASELLSNQLSNWLSQISDQVDIGVNYRPGVTDGVKEISNDQIELALSTQVFNDRVTIDGNIGNNSNPSANNSGEFIGEFDIKVKLTNDGRLQLKVYNHSNDGILNEEEPYTQGIGLSYREEFNTLKDLFRKYRNAILKKKKKKTGPKNEN